MPPPYIWTPILQCIPDSPSLPPLWPLPAADKVSGVVGRSVPHHQAAAGHQEGAHPGSGGPGSKGFRGSQCPEHRARTTRGRCLDGAQATGCNPLGRRHSAPPRAWRRRDQTIAASQTAGTRSCVPRASGTRNWCGAWVAAASGASCTPSCPPGGTRRPRAPAAPRSREAPR